MANPLIDLQKLVNPKKTKVLTAIVLSTSGQKVKVELKIGNTLTVWGVANVGDTVLIENSSIIAIVGKQTANTAYVP